MLVLYAHVRSEMMTVSVKIVFDLSLKFRRATVTFIYFSPKLFRFLSKEYACSFEREGRRNKTISKWYSHVIRVVTIRGLHFLPSIRTQNRTLPQCMDGTWYNIVAQEYLQSIHNIFTFSIGIPGISIMNALWTLFPDIRL